MANDNELQIILTLIDEASGKLKEITGEIKKDTAGIERASTDASSKMSEGAKSVREQFKEASAELKDFRRTLFLVSAALATVITTVKEASKYSKEAKDTYNEFTTATKTLSTTLGTMLAPAMEGISFVIRVLTDAIEAAVAGFIKLGTFVVEFFANITSGPVEAFKRAMEVSTIATDNFLNKMEETRTRVQQGLTLEKEGENVINLERITVTAAKKMKSSWDGVRDSLGNLGDQLMAAEELGRGFAKVGAAIALAMAIVHTAEGITRAYADYPWPFSMVVAGIIAAAGAIQIATISAQKFHSGGAIRAHSGLAVDEVPIIAQTGEGILSRVGMSALGGAGMLNRLNMGMSAGGFVVNNYIYNPVVRSDEDIDKLTEEISMRLAREAERL